MTVASHGKHIKKFLAEIAFFTTVQPLGPDTNANKDITLKMEHCERIKGQYICGKVRPERKNMLFSNIYQILILQVVGLALAAVNFVGESGKAGG